jgi:hypothetical protein
MGESGDGFNSNENDGKSRKVILLVHRLLILIFMLLATITLEIIFISSSVESCGYDTLETDPDSDDADSTTAAHD